MEWRNCADYLRLHTIKTEFMELKFNGFQKSRVDQTQPFIFASLSKGNNPN